MEQESRYEGLADDIRNECLNGMCKKLDKCTPGHKLCGISRGVKYGLYPMSAMKAPTTLVNGRLRTQINVGVGFKEIPLWKNGEGMGEFVKGVQSYKETWMLDDELSAT